MPVSDKYSMAFPVTLRCSTSSVLSFLFPRNTQSASSGIFMQPDTSRFSKLGRLATISLMDFSDSFVLNLSDSDFIFINLQALSAPNTVCTKESVTRASLYDKSNFFKFEKLASAVARVLAVTFCTFRRVSSSRELREVWQRV